MSMELSRLSSLIEFCCSYQGLSSNDFIILCLAYKGNPVLPLLVYEETFCFIYVPPLLEMTELVAI
jgi:hypothetical protein